MKKILIVDDEVDICEIMAETFELAGWQAVTASNGAEALEVLCKIDNIDAMISDVKMPVMDGKELLIQIKAMGLAVPHVYLLSGFSTINAEEAKDLGATALFRKPFNCLEICQTIENNYIEQS